jgi:hypothetical protein
VGCLLRSTGQNWPSMKRNRSGHSQPWKVIGNAAAPKCAPGDATYTFSAKQVVVGQCTGGAWTNRTEPMDTWSANGKSGIAFGGARYEVKALPAFGAGLQGQCDLRAAGHGAGRQVGRHTHPLPHPLMEPRPARSARGTSPRW